MGKEGERMWVTGARARLAGWEGGVVVEVGPARESSLKHQAIPVCGAVTS